MINICVIGSSLNWTPTLATDLMAVFDEPLEFRLLDVCPEASDFCAEWGKVATRALGRHDTFLPFTNRRAALKEADAVLITISTGAEDAAAHDVGIPEKYGIYATVGDTAGPGGWSRALRNIPVVRGIADDLDAVCPDAFVVNYSNPMAALTATLQTCCRNPSAGLCHAYFETKDVIQKLFGLPDWNAISLSIAGMNHFTWVIDFKIGRAAGYPLLRKKLAGRSLRALLPAHSADEIGHVSGHELCAELYDAFGYLPYPADRHTCEFVSFALTGHPARRTVAGKPGDPPFDTLVYCGIRRTAMSHRRANRAMVRQHLRAMTAGQEPLPIRSRETGAEMIRAYLHNHPFTDAVNTLNRGQIPGLPEAVCVETLACVDGMGPRPLLVENIPETLLEIMRPQAVAQKWIVDGALRGDREMLFHALLRDPQCAHLKPGDVRRMGNELIEANRPFMSEANVVSRL